VLVLLDDGSIYQSSNEGYTWNPVHPEQRFLTFYHHKFSNERAYLITQDQTLVFYTTDTGRSWNKFHAPLPRNTFKAQILRFSPRDTDVLIWVGDKNCGGNKSSCHAEAHLSRDNGRKWQLIEKYVKDCAFADDKQIVADPTEIICESWKIKEGQQTPWGNGDKDSLELVVGPNYYDPGRRRKIFDRVVGFAKFSEFLVVASVGRLAYHQTDSWLICFQLDQRSNNLELQVSLDGQRFAQGQFPPSMKPGTHVRLLHCHHLTLLNILSQAYTVLESSTKALFLHMTMSEKPHPYWGTILKSNSNGTYFGISIENVNRDERGYVDFEKVIGLDGIALVNIVSNTEEAVVTGRKELQTRITHNDGECLGTIRAS